MMAHKYFLLIVGVLLASATVQAQLIKAVGIKGGVTISNFRQSETYGINYDNVVNPSVSLFANFLETDYFSVQADLSYLRKEASVTYRVTRRTVENPAGIGSYVDYTDEFGFQYLALALAAQPRLPFEGVAVYARLGPTANYMLTVHNYGALGDFKRFQLGYVGGLGIEFACVFSSRLFFEIQYTGDFQPFYESSYITDYHRSWMLSLGTTL